MATIVTRFAAKDARKNGTKVLYTAHGFHFYNGAPLFNWLTYYPVDIFTSSNEDGITTINSEDYERIK
jgi:glycosyltransferase EpsD